MALIEPIDYVLDGLTAWPEKTRKENAMRFLAVYLSSIQNNEDALISLLESFLQWHRPGHTFSFVLDLIGQTVLHQARPASFGDEDYRLLLIARTLTRVSSGTYPEVVRVIDYLATINGGAASYSVTSGGLTHWTIVINDVVLTPQWVLLYQRLIQCTVCATDSWILYTPGPGAGLFDQLPGFDEALFS